MARVRALLVVLLLVLAGCTTMPFDRPYIPPPNDVPAPPPGDVTPVEFIEPAKGLPQVEVRGKVLDRQGRPVSGALLWVEGADLRQPHNNIDQYLERRAETLVRSAADGAYRFVLDEGFYHLTASAPGFHMQRFQPALNKALVEHDVVLRRDDITIVGHRGSHYYAPENTEASFVKSMWLGIDVVEVDVRVSRDGVMVVMHDRDLVRTTGHSGDVHETLYAKIRTLDAGRWFGADFAGQKVPTLDDAFAWAESYGVGLVLDMKAPPDNQTAMFMTWDGALDAIERWGFEDRAVFATFNEEGVRHCAKRVHVQCAWMTNDESKQRTVVREGQDMGADMLMLRRTMPDALLMAQAADAGITIHAWALNDPADWNRMLSLGLKWWGTDRPGYILDHLNRR